MTPSSPPQDLATQWNSALRLYPIYFELAREFVIEVQPCPDLESALDSPGKESVEQAQQWLAEMDQKIQAHQLRQFIQTSALVDQDGLLHMVQHFLAKTTRPESVRDKIDFLLVQYFSQVAPSRIDDKEVDLAFVAQSLESVLGPVDLKTPVWLNALDRVRESARRCRSLDELLHGGVLEQGRKAKSQAGDLFFLPIALVAFTRYGYLMRRVFFRLMHDDLNAILDGLTELEEKGVENIDCRRAQFSAEEPIIRLRMICQSWKVMFQAEYSSGQPLRMLVDLRASVDQALGRGAAAETKAVEQSKETAPARVAGKPATEKAVAVKTAPAASSKISPATKPAAKPAIAKAAAAASPSSSSKSSSNSSNSIQPVTKPADTSPAAKSKVQFAVSSDETPEFEISSESDWDAESSSQPGKK